MTHLAQDRRGRGGPIQDVEGREQIGGPVANVVVGLAGGNPSPQRQHRLGPVQCLDLRLLIHAKHQGFCGRMEIHTDARGGEGVGLRTNLQRDG